VKPIQPILIIVAVVAALVFYRRLRTRVLDRAVIVLATVSGVTLSAFPELSKSLAHVFGVGRGVDLVIYVGLVVLGLLWLELAARQRRLEVSLTEIARTLALRDAVEAPTERQDRIPES
jgi:hypothetical protein